MISGIDILEKEGEKKEIRPVISFGRRQQSARMPRWFSSRHLSVCSTNWKLLNQQTIIFR